MTYRNSRHALLLVALGVGAYLAGFFHSGGSSTAPIATIVLETPGPTADAVIPVRVSSSARAAGDLYVDVDLNHDGRFSGLGELGYARARLTEKERTVRLHGLVDGSYQVRARLSGSQGREAVSEEGTLHVLPPPGNRLPVTFEPNKGQSDSSVLFLGRARNQTAYITATETVLVSPRTVQVQRFRLAGANAGARPVGRKRLPGSSNYFVSSDPKNWHTDIEHYQEVVTREVYPGIDLVYHSSQGRLEYDFRVAPGADPAVITLEFPDAGALAIDEDGGLVLRLAGGQELRKSAPIMYQEVDRNSSRSGATVSRQAVKGDWVLKGPKQASYVVADYDAGRELVIDPVIFATYLGGSGREWGLGVAVDGSDNIYVAGFTASADFPTTAGAAQTTTGGSEDLVVAKLNPTGTAVLYATYVGGSSFDSSITFGQGIAVDGAGNAYVCASSQSNNFPTTAGAFQTTKNGSRNATVTKINAAGNALAYSTYLGGSTASGDEATAIAVDAAGNAYVTGLATSANFPTTAGALQTTFGGSFDGFVTKLNPTGTALVYSTLLGGNGIDVGSGITVNSAGNAYVTGRAASVDFPTSAGAYQSTHGGPGNSDVFVTKLNPAGTALDFSTFLGGPPSEEGQGIAVDATGNVYVSGFAQSTFPTSAGAAQTTFGGGGGDLFVAKFNPTGTTLTYSTYLGGSGFDKGFGLAVDSTGRAYVAGQVTSTNFPVVNPTQATSGGGADATVSVLNPTGTAILFSTYLGGSGDDEARALALDSAGNILVTGKTTGSFTTVAPVQATFGGGTEDFFIAKITPNFAAAGGVTITQSGGSTNVAEGGATDTYTVVLNTAPTANVTIGLSVSSQYTLSPLSLVFTPANWNTAQTVTVTATDDALVEGPHTAPITHNATSTDTAYNGIAIGNVTVNITDNDAAPPAAVLYGITLNSNELITINTTTAAGTLVGPLSSNMNAFGIAFRGPKLYAWDDVGGQLRELNPATGATIGSINLGAIPGPGGEGDIVFRADGMGFLAAQPAAGELYRFDITVPNSTLVGPVNPPMDGLAFNAGGVLYGLSNGGTALYTLDTTTGATALVGNTGIVGLPANTSGGLSFDASGNLFAALSPWPPGPSSLYRISTTTGVATLVGNIGFNGVSGISFQPPAAAAGVTVTQSGGATNVTEGGATDTYTVVLNSAPTANVTITLSAGTQAAVAPATLTFTPANWNVPQTITVTAVDDALVEGSHTGSITHTSASTDAAYNGSAIAGVTVNITDNDGSPPPGPGSGPEGAFGAAGSSAGAEGSFAGAGRARLGPTLRGPFAASPGHQVVFNVSHQRPAVLAADEQRAIPGWMLGALAIVALAATAAAVAALRR